MGRKAISIEHIVRRDGLRCHYCREFMNIYHNPTRRQQYDQKRFTFEHVVPKCHGGTYGLYNIVGACAACNGAMGNQALKCFCNFCQNARVQTELRQLLGMSVA